MRGMDVDAYLRAVKFIQSLDREYVGNRDAGWLYVLRNPELRHALLKIGMTRRAPFDRAEELGASTSIPGKFEILYFVHVGDARTAEQYAHDLLSDVRYDRSREFFATSIQRAVRTLDRAVEQFPLLRSQRNKGNRHPRSKAVPQAFPTEILSCGSCGQRNRVRVLAVAIASTCGRCGAGLQ
jgi:hypothetical protein